MTVLEPKGARTPNSCVGLNDGTAWVEATSQFASELNRSIVTGKDCLEMMMGEARFNGNPSYIFLESMPGSRNAYLGRDDGSVRDLWKHRQVSVLSTECWHNSGGRCRSEVLWFRLVIVLLMYRGEQTFFRLRLPADLTILWIDHHHPRRWQ